MDDTSGQSPRKKSCPGTVWGRSLTCMNTRFSRRRFLATAAASAAPLILPGRVLGLDGATAPNSKVRLAGIGVGGMGRRYLEGCASERVVALCDAGSQSRPCHRARAA